MNLKSGLKYLKIVVGRKIKKHRAHTIRHEKTRHNINFDFGKSNNEKKSINR